MVEGEEAGGVFWPLACASMAFAMAARVAAFEFLRDRGDKWMR